MSKMFDLANKLCSADVEMDAADDLLTYLREDIESEIYSLAKQGQSGLVRYQCIEMMFSLLHAAVDKLCKAQILQKEVADSLLDISKAEKEKAPTDAGTSSKSK